MLNSKTRALNPADSNACFSDSPMPASAFEENAIKLGPAPDNATAFAPASFAASIADNVPGINLNRYG